MRAYLHALLLVFVATLLVVAGFNRLIDPAGYWHGPIIDGLNRFKPASAEHVEAVKLRQIARNQPTTLIAGNSRVDVGFDPESRAWLSSAGPVYNLGLPGLRAAGVVDVLLRAFEISRPRHVLLGVDFVDFRIAPDRWRAGISEPTGQSRMAATDLGQHMRMLLSLGILNASLAAIPEQWKTHPAHITPSGFNSLAEYRDIVAKEGHAALFDQRRRENVAAYAAGPKRVSWPGPGRSVEWVALERLAAECRRKGIRLTVFTYPYHAEQLLMFERTGLWPAFADWQRRLAEFGARQRVPVWDFARVAPMTAEPIPEPGDTATQMRYYWEAGHFKAPLGDLVVADIFGTPRLGRRLVPATVERETAATRATVADYAIAHPRAVAAIDAITRTRIAQR